MTTMFADFKTDAPIFAAIRVVGGAMTQRDVHAIKGAIAEAVRIKDDKPIFDIARELDDDDDGLSKSEVKVLQDGLSAARKGDAVLPPVARGREIGADGLALIKQFEGLELTAYLCPAKVWTVGYGSTGPHVRPGMTITEADAERLLRQDLDRFEEAVDKAAPGTPQPMFDAMVSFAFNVGIGAFERSTLLRLHKAGQYHGAKGQFAAWNKAGGRVLPGLTRRRAAEASLYGKGIS